MRHILARLKRGEPSWTVEVALRAIGPLLLCGCGLLGRAVYRQVHRLPPHLGNAGEFALAALIVAMLWSGLGLAFAGSGLFRPVPMPPRPFL